MSYLIALYFGLGIDTQDGLGKAVKIVGTGNQNILQSAILQTAEHLQPEVGLFTFRDIAATPAYHSG